MTSIADERVELLERDLELMRERYNRLADAHGQLQMQNSHLEERLLVIVEAYSKEKNLLEQALVNAKQEVFDLKDTVNELEIKVQRYKDDCNLAVRLLHHHPNAFAPPSLEELKKELPIKNEPTPPSSPHSLLIPTFPPTFVTSLPWLKTTSTSSDSQVTASTESLRFSETLFKSNTVHRYPTTHFLCSNCHQTIKCYDVSVQTPFHENNGTSLATITSEILSDDKIYIEPSWITNEPYLNKMTNKQCQLDNVNKISQNSEL